MKRIFYILSVTVAMIIVSCDKSDFEDSYSDPSKVATSSVEKQFTGFLVSNKDYVLPNYWNYFVVLRTTLTHYTQAVGWVNSPNQYIPGAAGVSDRWTAYYKFLTQYRELEKVYASLSPAQQDDMRIYMITASIYLYDHTQKVIDLHGDIPFLDAGKLSTNGGDYQKSLAKYDSPEALYTKMLDDLKGFSDELNSITVKSVINTSFKNQDIVNKGNLDLWKKYCNSLRLRMLTRVSNTTSFQTRANTEIGAILANSANYPVVANNADNIQINVFNLDFGGLDSKGFREGLESGGGNLAGKAMIDHMNTNNDPRLKALFEPGENAAGAYVGLDPMALTAVQDDLLSDSKIAFYNRSTLSRNQFFPGVLINAAEVSFLMSEYYLKSGNNGAAKTAYENGIKQSTEYYAAIRALSNDNAAGNYTVPTVVQIQTYIAGINVNWDLAITTPDKLKLIATQKWIHYSVVQPTESWAENRRLDLPQLSFQIGTGEQKTPPYRWNYPTSEAVYNTENYNAVKSKDNLTTKLFWDVN
ncbi:SusD/RagB family nutrient-binding outer membrane lipoprotein [Flavobacterium rhamnosiphilum]|uniref:SusD/RagB family nutrient-binding outer membrane lipoprotein n=1 Tax=Flavobacterium rhamnosiphilum TaxID=2541724 RepID=A0A4R5FAS3_9FLAO|nr:SusD/RagB family nutrient-binding outer membrane lipoprotein [Flavobacterium rhamnosiphilum]TDE45975.1 SusD/RagB family nutrient-binding outer membrane lipoprotein [Flavobacterium rhamnosiphilum]